MSDTPNNQPIEEQENSATPDFENSTIFSDPVNYGTKNEKSKKHWLRRGFLVGGIVLVAGALAAGWFLVQKFLPEASTGASSSNTISGTGVAVTDIDPKKVASLEISSGDKTVVLQQVIMLPEADRPSTVDEWIVKGIDPVVTSSSIISYRVEDACALTAIRTMGSGLDYGLTDPTKSVKAIMDDGTEIVITIGKESPDKIGFYCSVSTEPDKVFLVETSALSLIEADPLYYADKTVIRSLSAEEVGSDYFQGENSTLNRFSSISITGNKIEGKIALGMTTDKTKYNLYSLTAPIKAFADELEVLSLLSPISNGLTVSSAVSYDFEGDKAKYGLDDPAYVAEYKIGDYTETIWVSNGDPDGGCYVALGQEPKAIYSTYTSNLPYEGLDVTGLYTPYPFFENITTVSKISISGPEGDYAFDLTHIENQEDSKKNLKVVCQEREVDVQSFRYFYQHLVKLSAISFVTEPTTGEPSVTIKISFIGEGAEDTILTFAKLSDMRYHLCVNGTPYGIVSASDIKNLFADCDTLASGGTINS